MKKDVGTKNKIFDTASIFKRLKVACKKKKQNKIKKIIFKRALYTLCDFKCFDVSQ